MDLPICYFENFRLSKIQNVMDVFEIQKDKYTQLLMAKEPSTFKTII